MLKVIFQDYNFHLVSATTPESSIFFIQQFTFTFHFIILLILKATFQQTFGLPSCLLDLRFGLLRN